MKRLFLVRHAKSGWKNSRMADLNRPLTKKGKAEALIMGKWLKQNNLKPESIFSSPAKRAYDTAYIIALEIGYPLWGICTDKLLYKTNTQTFLEIIKKTNEAVEQIMLVGHNPEYAEFCNYLMPEKFDDYPTSSVVIIDFTIQKWSKVAKGTGKLAFFDYPKKRFADEKFTKS